MILHCTTLHWVKNTALRCIVHYNALYPLVVLFQQFQFHYRNFPVSSIQQELHWYYPDPGKVFNRPGVAGAVL